MNFLPDAPSSINTNPDKKINYYTQNNCHHRKSQK